MDEDYELDQESEGDFEKSPENKETINELKEKLKMKKERLNDIKSLILYYKGNFSNICRFLSNLYIDKIKENVTDEEQLRILMEVVKQKKTIEETKTQLKADIKAQK